MNVLRHIAHTFSCALDGLTEYMDPASIRSEKPQHDFEERRFASAVRSHNAGEIPFRDG